jgi:hypothetical protein
MEFEKTIELNSFDIYHYGLFARKRFIIIVSSVIFVFCFMLIHFVFQNRFSFIPALICSLVLSLIFIAYYIYNIKNRSRSTVKEYRLSKLPKHITINETGYHSVSELGSTSMPWNDMRKPKETEYAFYFFLHFGSGYVIPKRLLNDDETAVILEIIKKRFPKQGTPS